jgi:hypothetical protein
MGVTLGRQRRKLRCRGNILHGVVSCPALQRRVIRGLSPWRLRHHQFPPTQRRDRTHGMNPGDCAAISSFARCESETPEGAKNCSTSSDSSDSSVATRALENPPFTQSLSHLSEPTHRCLRHPSGSVSYNQLLKFGPGTSSGLPAYE